MSKVNIVNHKRFLARNTEKMIDFNLLKTDHHGQQSYVKTTILVQHAKYRDQNF